MLMSLESQGAKGVTVEVKVVSIRVRSRRVFIGSALKEPLYFRKSAGCLPFLL